MKVFGAYSVFILCTAVSVHALRAPRIARRAAMSRWSTSNVDEFGGGSVVSTEEPVAAVVEDESSSDSAPKGVQLTKREQAALDAANKLRQEAEEMEFSLREEARSKGMPEEVINKLVPKTSQSKTKAVQYLEEKVTGIKSTPTPKATTSEAAPVIPALPASQIRQKLGYLNTGDAVRMTSELDRLKGKGMLSLWNSHEDKLDGARFSVNNYQLKEKAKIEPQDLKLDDVGYDYQKTFLISLAVASIFGIGSSLIPEDYGPLGFVLGYASALFPILIVGIGSIAPGLIGDILNRIKLASDAEAKDRFIAANAGKFLVGYVMGLPVSTFASSGPSNSADFFQLRPSGNEADDRKMFSENKFKQADIARSSAVCLASSVAECMGYESASGTQPGDVNTLYELMSACEPKLEGERLQDHIRWSALEAYKIINEHPEAYQRLIKAFGDNLPMEECIACLEGTGDVFARDEQA